MDQLTATFLVGSIIVVGLIIFTYTKRGKKWLENL